MIHEYPGHYEIRMIEWKNSTPDAIVKLSELADRIFGFNIGVNYKSALDLTQGHNWIVCAIYKKDAEMFHRQAKALGIKFEWHRNKS